MTSKVCKGCSKDLDLTFFAWKNKSKNQLQSRCKICCNTDQKVKWGTNYNGARDKGRAASRRYNYTNRYNLPEELVKQLLENNEGHCKICGIHTTLFVDHCHTTGNYRGLICRSCNLVLGYAKDNPVILESASSYLKTQFS